MTARDPAATAPRRLVGSGGPWRSTAVMALGAVAYGALVGLGHVTFYATPLLVGSVAVAAALLGPLRHLLGAGLSLIGWGAAVLAIHVGVIPGARTTPAYMIGIGLGFLAVRVVAPPASRAEWMTSAAASVTVAGLGYFLAFDHPSLGRWPAWALTLLAWAAYEAVRPRLERGSRPPRRT